MNEENMDIISPDLIHRVRGGFLAVSKRTIGVRLGAMGKTEDQARSAFCEVVQIWLRARKAENAAEGNVTQEKKNRNNQSVIRQSCFPCAIWDGSIQPKLGDGGSGSC